MLSDGTPAAILRRVPLKPTKVFCGKLAALDGKSPRHPAFPPGMKQVLRSGSQGRQGAWPAPPLFFVASCKPIRG